MKTKIKRFSKRSLAVFLGVVMLVSCIGLGSLITFNAVNASDWVLVGNINNSNNWDQNNGVVMEAVSGGYSATVTLTNSKDFRIRHNNQNYGNNSKNVVVGTYSMSQTNSTFLWTGTTGEYTVTINSDGSQITFSSDGGGGATPVPNTYFYSGTATDTDWVKTAMTVSDDGNYEYFKVSGSNTFKIGTNGDQWAYGGQSANLYSGYNDTDVTLSDAGGNDHNIRSSQAGTHYIIVYLNDVAGAEYDVPIICASTTLPSTSAGTKVTDADLLAVLNGTKVMYYGGELISWGNNTFYVMSSNNTSNAVASGTMSGTYTIGGQGTYEFALFTTAANDYYMGHWDSGLHTTPVAGKAYVVRGSISNNYHTEKAVSGANYLYELSNSETTSLSTTISSSIAHGSQLSVSTGLAGTSVLGLENTIEYYIYDGTNYYSAEVSDGKIDTSELAVKNGYVLKTVLKDTNGLYVVADSDTFNVETAYSVTFSAGTGGNISPSGSQTVCITTPTAVTATANTGYQFSSWTRSNVTLTNDAANGDGRTANVTASAAGSLTANFTKKSYTLTHGSKTNGTFTTSVDSSNVASGGSVIYQKTVTVNCTPNTGYKVSTVTYTPNGGSTTAASGSGSSRTFSMPAANTTVTVTFAKKDNAISTSANPAGGGNVWIGSASNTAYANRKTNYQIDDTVYLRASADEAYTFDHFVLTYGDGTTETFNSNSSSVTLDLTHYGTGTGAISLVGYFNAKPTYEVSAQTNNALYGTVSVSDATAYEGKEITVTTNEKSGTLSGVVITKTSDGSDVTSSVSYNSGTKKFTMPAYAVTVKATFTAYSEDSDFFYNGYDSSANEMTGTYYGQKMTKAKIGGETFSYYHVTGRTETDQLFTVSYGDPTDNGTVYFEAPTSWGDKYGWDANYIDIQFLSSDDVQLKDWQHMTWDKDADSNKYYKCSIPYGARKAQIRAEKNMSDSEQQWPYTAVFDLTSYTEDCITITNSSHNGQTFSNLGSRNIGNQSKLVASGFYENFNGTSKYTSSFSTSGFYSHSANHTGSHAYNKPNGLGDNKGDYYIIVLYENKTYTINGVTETVTLNPEIIWMPELPEGVEEKIPVYAKDGAVSHETSTTASDLSIGQQIADTAISGAGLSGLSTTTYYQKAKVDIGSEITITTTIKNTTKAVSSTESENLRDLYYVKAFSINGKCYALNEWNSSGVYTTKYTVQPSDTYVEITPIFFLKDSSGTGTFYLDGFTDTFTNAGWGETIYVYPFYTDPDVDDDDVSGGNNAFGKYPGQPVVNYGGKYFTQIPMSYYTTDEKSHTKVCTVEGVVINNGYSDKVHCTKLGSYTKVTSEKQTYDFKDFYTINEALHPDRIIYTFKYRSGEENNNRSPSSEETRASVTSDLHEAKSLYTGTHTSEFLKDTHGRYVDIFGKVLTTQPDGEPSDGTYLSVYSVGYVKNASGNYATEWVVYDTSGNIIKYSNSDKSIIPSALYFSSSSQLSTYGLDDYENMYNTLNNTSYTDKPVKICYEQEIEVNSAYRSDGVWLHSSDNDIISANIKIQYMASGSSVYVDDTMSYNAGTATSSGSTTGAKAYFTNTDTNKAGATYNGNYQTGELYSSSSKDFTFTAVSNGNYIFQGWYRVNNDGKETLITTENDASTDMTSSDTYIARFKYVTSGALNLTASMDPSYTGHGIAKIGVEVLNSSDEVKKSYELGSGAITVPSTYIKSDSTYKLRVTLQTVASGDYRFNAFSSDASATFFGGSTSKSTTNNTNDTGTRTFTFNVTDLYTSTTQNVLSLSYTSTLDRGKPCTVEYNYTGLKGKAKTYTTKAYSFESISNGTDVTSLTVGNRGVTFQTWVGKHVPAVDSSEYSHTWTIETLTYTSDKITVNATSTANTTVKVVEKTNSTSGVNTVAKNAYSSGTRILTCPEALKGDFKYWSVYNGVVSDGNLTKGSTEMARCYSYDFTLQLTQDSYIELETESNDSEKALISPPTYNREVFTSGESTIDKVYAEFIVAYMNNEVSLNGNKSYSSGIVVEFNENTTVSASYNGETFDSDKAVVSAFAGGEASQQIYKKDGQSGRNALVRFLADDLRYNNFNRLNMRIGFNNNTSWINRVMKAYYYVKDSSGNVSLSEPVYFCLYDKAVEVYDYNT